MQGKLPPPHINKLRRKDAVFFIRFLGFGSRKIVKKITTLNNNTKPHFFHNQKTPPDQ
jgi:hypothetical protein